MLDLSVSSFFFRIRVDLKLVNFVKFDMGCGYSDVCDLGL